MTHEAGHRGRVLVTGCDGYIGSVLVPHLWNQGYEVVGLDAGWFGSCILGQSAAAASIRCDIRDLTIADLEGFQTVVHLAALSNDPIGNLNSNWTDEINTEGSFRLAELSRRAGVRRFIFSSSCIMYGAAATGEVNEDSPLDPQTDYARSKVAAEHRIRELADDSFSPVFLRNGTVYGFSPRMRLDTVLNSFVASAMVDGCVVVRSNGEPWRPVVHIKDLVRSMEHVIQAPARLVHNQSFNNGADHLNIQIRDLAQAAAAAVPGSTIEICARGDADHRTYRACFDKFATTFPSFQFHWSPAAGARDLYSDFRRVGFGRNELEGDRFVRLRWLNRLLESGRLDRNLRWSSMEAAAS